MTNLMVGTSKLSPTEPDFRRVRAMLRVAAAIVLIAVAITLQPDVVMDRLFDHVRTEPAWHRYLVILSAIAFAAAALVILEPLVPGGRICRWIVGILVCFLMLEMASAMYFHLRGIVFLKLIDSAEFHPLLAAVSKPNFHEVVRFRGRALTFTHDLTGARICPNNGPPSPAPLRIVAFGGSTTYDLGVSDCETWPYLLGRSLGQSVSVRNLGMRGHATPEHIIMSAFTLPEEHANIALYYVGWNDIQSSHVRPLKSDYSNFHFPMQYLAQNVDFTYTSNFASLALLKRALVGAGLVFSPATYAEYSGISSGGVDQELLRLYARNIQTIIVLARTAGAEPVFIPQVFRPGPLDEHVQWGERWVPFVKIRDLPTTGRAFNEVLTRTALQNNAKVIDNVLKVQWVPEDFVDEGHFSVRGSEKFASAVAEGLKRQELAP
jgi:lysophospholipase L1-like esterase